MLTKDLGHQSQCRVKHPDLVLAYLILRYLKELSDP
jgi:hypothetical protein